MRFARPLVALLCCVASVGGCAFIRPAKKPMPFESYASLGPARAHGVIVLLPGFGDRASTFDERGFVDVLEKRAPGYDVVAADAHFGYYRTRSLVRRLDADVIGPLRKQGYREIWLSGASMGGHGAIAYVRNHPERISGLMLFAPYMGPRPVVEEVKRAGGLCAWRPTAGYVDDEHGFARANFAWLKEHACGSESRVSLWLGVGASDRLLEADRLIAEHLDPSHVVVLPGGHGWKVWTPALDRIAARAFADAEPVTSVRPLARR